MKVSFLGQGLTPQSPNSVGNKIIVLFKEIKFHSFTCISAFASEAGVYGLAECISSSHIKSDDTTIIVGIDQEGTPVEALQELISLRANSYIFYQREPPIFHPKIYLFEGMNETAFIVGSSNLTARGLFGNVESSILLEFSNENLEGKKVLKEFKDYYKDLLNFSDPNLFKLTSEIITNFVSEGIVPNKSIWTKRHSRKNSEQKLKEKQINVPKRTTSKIPNIFKRKLKTNKTVSKVVSELEINENVDFSKNSSYEIVMETNPLTERDLNIPKGKNTNVTGSMGLKKGKLKNIDQRHYFRDRVFSSLNWVKDSNKRTAHLERTNVNIRIVILGVDYGIYTLKLTHSTNTNSTSYKQKNSMTQLSWEGAKELIAQEGLLRRTAFLYKSKKKPHRFTLEIK